MKLADVIEALNGAVRPLVCLGMVGTYCGMAVFGKVPLEGFSNNVAMVIGFYFMARMLKPDPPANGQAPK